MSRFGKWPALTGVILVVLGTTTARAELLATVDRQQLALGDTLQLTITATDGEDVSELDLEPITRDFEILKRSSSTQTSIVNGRYSSTRALTLDITPRREGDLLIPALRAGTQASNSLQLNVGPPPRGIAGDHSLVFEAEVDRESVYVQGQVILTLRLQQAINLDDRAISELELDDAFVRPLEQQSFQRTINGKPWLVHEVRYAIFPEQSGTLTIPAQQFSARESIPRRSFFDSGGGGRQLRRSTDALEIEVLPRPPGYPDTTWLPALDLTVEESWSIPPEQLRVGESATRTITLRGTGLQGAQLPPVMFPATEGLKYYPDQPVVADSENATGLVGTRVDSVAVVPTKAGSWNIPELRIAWWDTTSNQLRYATLPARQLDVAAADPAITGSISAPLPNPQTSVSPTPGAAPISVVSASGADSLPWQVLSVFTGLGWLCTLGYVVWSRRKNSGGRKQEPDHNGNASESAAFKAALAACKAEDPASARQAVVTWAALSLPEPAPVSLDQVASAFADPTLAQALNTLNSALYASSSSAWDGTALAECLRRVRATANKSSTTAQGQLSLYPGPG